MSINVAYVKKIEDTLICTNDTDCNESIDLTIQNPEALADLSNDTEQTTTAISTETTSLETTSKINSNITDQPELQSTTISSTTVAVPLNDNEILSFKKKELCECDLIVCTLYFY